MNDNYSDEELRLRLSNLRVAPPDEDVFRANLLRKLEETPVEARPAAKVIPLARKGPRVALAAFGLALAGVAAAATLRLVQHGSDLPSVVAEQPGQPKSAPVSNTERHGNPEPTRLEPTRQETPREEPHRQETPRRLDTPPRSPERLTVPRTLRTDSAPQPREAPRTEPAPTPSVERRERNLQRLELPRAETTPRAGEPSTRTNLDRNTTERRPGDQSVERAGPDRSLTKVGPGGTPREDRMPNPGLPERRPGAP